MTSSPPSNITISTVFLLLLTTVVITTPIPDHEYHSMLSALRYRGYHLFANAITTTDLHYDIMTSNNTNFTLFAPIDSALYALDMTLSASDYTNVLKFHCVPHRITLTDLFYNQGSLPSLVQGHEIHVVNPLTLRSPVMVEGVGIIVPGLFYGVHVAVHGLEGVMEFRSLKDRVNSSSVAVNVTEIISESVSQPREEDMRTEVMYEKIHDVSLARISQLDDNMNDCVIEEDGLGIANVRVSDARRSELISESIGCSIEEGDGERLDVANVRRGDVYL